MFVISMVKDMTNKPKFSIIVATRDRRSDLYRLLSSLKKTGILTREDIEVIIADNNSSDESIKNVCIEFGVTYLLEKKRGKSFALNAAIKKAKGSYLIFADDDVVIKDSRWIDKLYSHFKNPFIGYVSGNVVANHLKSESQRVWEKKGGLSKGAVPKYFDKKFLSSFKIKPWPLTKICAGANCMIPKKIILRAGGYCTLFGPGGLVGHGESLIIGYEIIRLGYELYYDPLAKVYHNHPEKESEIKKKLFTYAIGDTALHMYLFMNYRDFRSLYWALIGHQLYLLNNMIKRLRGKYPLPLDFIIFSMAGSISGPWIFIYRYELINFIKHLFSSKT
mgnify:CR=1 FL=1